MNIKEFDRIFIDTPSSQEKRWYTILLISAIAFVLLVFSGCTTLPIDYRSLSAEQIKEIVKDKGIMAQCSTVNSPYGRGIVVIVGIDKGTLPNGNVTVDDQCKITTTTGTPKQ